MVIALVWYLGVSYKLSDTHPLFFIGKQCYVNARSSNTLKSISL